jgi:hypothetical protein
MSLAGQRAQFTWALNQYNVAETTEQKTRFAKRMALIIQRAPSLDFTKEQVVNGQVYPPEVDQYLQAPVDGAEPDISEEQAQREVDAAVDTSDMLEEGKGPFIVYAYGYSCAPDRLKIGLTTGDPIQRVAAQISTGTPDRPALHLQIKTNDCNALERALHAMLEVHGRKVVGGGKEWFLVTREEILEVYRRVTAPLAPFGQG